MKKVILFSVLLVCSLKTYSQKKDVFKDPRDGKIYQTVKIRRQTWMAENMAYKTDSGCMVYNNKADNVTKYGYLYNFEAAKNVCPVGWHLPNVKEWDKLLKHLGIRYLIGYKLKSKTDWEGSGNGTNETGFNALPAGGFIFKEGLFRYIGTIACFWTSTVYPHFIDESDVYLLFYHGNNVAGGNFSQKDAYSVRCIKD